MIDAVLLADFAKRFFGYGSWNARLWFVGMEEGGGASLEEMEKRLAAWDRSDELADIRDYHARIGETRWFGPEPKIQSTWGKLIRITLAADGRSIDQKAVRCYQRDEFGGRSGDTAVVELLPLASRSISDWLYAGSGEAKLQSRDSYTSSLVGDRIAVLRRRIHEHQPAAVVFYGLAYGKYWRMITGAEFEKPAGASFGLTRRNGTLFVEAKHPVATGVSNSEYEHIGIWIRDHTRPRSSART